MSRIYAGLAVFGWALLLNAMVADAQQISSDTVMNEWMRRQATFSSGRIEWKETRFLAQGRVAPKRDAADAIPPQDARSEHASQLVFSGDNVLYAGKQLVWSAAASKMNVLEWVATTDSRRSRRMFIDAEPVNWPRQAWDYEFDDGWIKSMQAVTPPLMFYRPQLYREYIESFTFSGRRGTVDGVPCIVLERHGHSASALMHTLWLDPARSYLVLRSTFEQQERPVGQTDITYHQDPQHGWIPMAWQDVRYTSDGFISNSENMEVLEASLNVEIPPEQFDIRFPTGTIVNRQEVPEEEFPGVFIVREDGSLRPVLREEFERSATMHDLLTTAPGRAAIPEKRVPWLGIASVLLVLLAACYFGHRLYVRMS